MQTTLGILAMKIQILVSLDKYFADTANANFGRLKATARPLFRACRPGYEKTTIGIEFNYHSIQKASYRIKRVLMHILSGYVLELITTGIFYEFLNIYKILRILREQVLSNFKGLKSHPIHDFKHKKTFHVKKQSLSFQNKLSKLWATHEMNFWERKVHGAFKCALTFLT